jgi:hypothetical protein
MRSIGASGTCSRPAKSPPEKRLVAELTEARGKSVQLAARIASLVGPFIQDEDVDRRSPFASELRLVQGLRWAAPGFLPREIGQRDERQRRENEARLEREPDEASPRAHDRERRGGDARHGHREKIPGALGQEMHSSEDEDSAREGDHERDA